MKIILGIAAALAIAATLAVALPSASANEPSPPASLRAHAVIDGDVVSIGDLFTDAGAAASVVVAYAPAPGRRAVFDANWLTRVARRYGIDWQPLGHMDRVVVERRSTVVDAEHLTMALRDELVLLGIGETFEMELSNPRLEIHIAADMPPTVDVASLAVDDRSGRFVATVRVPAGDPKARTVKLTGRISAVIDVPMLARAMRPGDTIGADDLIWIRMRSRQVRGNMISDAAELVGQEPRRLLRAETPIRRSDLRSPLAVHKGAAVTMVAQTPTMTLTATGRALDDGSRGDVVRVMNSRTKRVIEAMAAGPERVHIVMPDHLALRSGAAQ